jgi:hypothetical protein
MSNNIPRNKTRTFDLTPGEKPDMSPYLFHLTTKDNLISILEQQKLILNIPLVAYEDKHPYKMVCFTESPPFALDFFRYRWSDKKDRINLEYGLGFSKETMVQKGVYPTIYLDASLFGYTKELKKRVDGSQKLTNEMKKKMELLVAQISPLFENEELQGYTWEREWRYTRGDYLKFDYFNISYICCPLAEQEAIRKVIEDSKEAEAIQNIQFLENWQEYNEITTFLQRKQLSGNDELEELLAEKCRTHNLISYYDSHYKKIDELKSHLSQVVNYINNKKEEIEDIIKREAILEYVEENFGEESSQGGVERIISDKDTDLDRIIANIAYCVNRRRISREIDGRYIYKSIDENYANNLSQEVQKYTNKIIKDIKICMNSSFNSKWEKIINPVEKH